MKTFGLAVAIGLLFTSAISVSFAQDTTSSGKSKAHVGAITGCLAQGSSSDLYVLNGDDGSAWNVKSDTITLIHHVGHTVTAKGTISNVTLHNVKEETKDAVASTGMKKTNNEHGDLHVTSVKTVSKSCK